MSRLISDILGASEPYFSHAVRSWEEKSGRAGHDVRLISEVSLARKKAVKELNLDETDTNAKELYYALRHRATETNIQLEAHLHITHENTSQEVTQKIVDFVESIAVAREVWTIKHTVIKQLLKKQPPKKLMKVLGLRSIDSMLKRSSAYELLALAYQLETPEWSAKMRAQFKKLKPIDFHSISSSIYQVEAAKLEKLYKGGYNASNILVPNYETGSIIILPPKRRFALDTLALTLSLLQTLYDLRVYSAYFRHISVKSNFGTQLHKVITEELPGKLHSNQIGWKALQKHVSQHPESFERLEQPQLQYEDMILAQPITLLEEAVPSLSFWIDKAFVFMPDTQRPVSLHLMDVVVNASNQLSYEQGSYAHLQNRLWEELGVRYLANDAIQTAVIEVIDGPSDI